MFAEITLIDYQRPLRDRLESRKHCGPYRWRPNTKNNGIGFYQSSTGLAMDSHGSALRLRLEECPSAYPRGIASYDCGADQEMIPIIARLPRSRGFLAGWTMGQGMCASLGNTIYDSEEDAHLAAHGEAESAAEAERIYQQENPDDE